MTGAEQRYPKSQRLRKRPQFLALNQGSRRLRLQHFIFLARPNGLAVWRLGITASRRVGSAVKRNRIKRLVREAFRLSGPYPPPGWDLVVIARVGAHALALDDVRQALTRARQKLTPPSA